MKVSYYLLYLQNFDKTMIFFTHIYFEVDCYYSINSCMNFKFPPHSQVSKSSRDSPSCSS